MSYVLTPTAGKLAWKIGAIHHPGERRVHSRPTPGFGGMAIYIGFMVAVLIVIALDKSVPFDRQVLAILAAGTVVAICGAIDDKYDISPILQILGIVIATLILVRYGIKISHVTKPFNSPHLVALGALSIPITIIWVFGVTKTVDLMDGMDGLASGICAIVATTLLLMAIQAKSQQTALAGSFRVVAIMAGALIGANLGFLRHNYPPAKIFMGTIGSQFMGFIIASLSIVGAFKVAALVAVAVPVVALGVPILDATFVVVRRFLDRRPVHLADKSHVHHRLLERGMSHSQVVLIIYGLTMVLSAAALTLYVVSR
jgi:UDP-GlcNAc:undecaprenyl-phosphate GlcNAc-1-phosphate transferase